MSKPRRRSILKSRTALDNSSITDNSGSVLAQLRNQQDNTSGPQSGRNSKRISFSSQVRVKEISINLSDSGGDGNKSIYESDDMEMDHSIYGPDTSGLLQPSSPTGASSSNFALDNIGLSEMTFAKSIIGTEDTENRDSSSFVVNHNTSSSCSRYSILSGRISPSRPQEDMFGLTQYMNETVHPDVIHEPTSELPPPEVERTQFFTENDMEQSIFPNSSNPGVQDATQMFLNGGEMSMCSRSYDEPMKDVFQDKTQYFPTGEDMSVLDFLKSFAAASGNRSVHNITSEQIVDAPAPILIEHNEMEKNESDKENATQGSGNDRTQFCNEDVEMAMTDDEDQNSEVVGDISTKDKRILLMSPYRSKNKTILQPVDMSCCSPMSRPDPITHKVYSQVPVVNVVERQEEVSPTPAPITARLPPLSPANQIRAPKVLQVGQNGKALVFQAGKNTSKRAQPDPASVRSKIFSIRTPRQRSHMQPLFPKTASRMISAEVQTSPFLMASMNPILAKTAIEPSTSTISPNDANKEKSDETPIMQKQTISVANSPCFPNSNSFMTEATHGNNPASKSVFVPPQDENRIETVSASPVAPSAHISDVSQGYVADSERTRLSTAISLAEKSHFVSTTISPDTNTDTSHVSISPSREPKSSNPEEFSHNAPIKKSKDTFNESNNNNSTAHKFFNSSTRSPVKSGHTPPLFAERVADIPANSLCSGISPGPAVFENSVRSGDERPNISQYFQQLDIDEPGDDTNTTNLKFLTSSYSYSMVEKSGADCAKQDGEEEFSIDIRNSMSMVSTNFSPSMMDKSRTGEQTLPSRGESDVSRDSTKDMSKASHDAQHVMNTTRTIHKDNRNLDMSSQHNSFKIVLNETYCCSDRVFPDPEKTEIEKSRSAAYSMTNKCSNIADSTGILEVSNGELYQSVPSEVPTSPAGANDTYETSNALGAGATMEISCAEPIFPAMTRNRSPNLFNVTQEEMQLTGLLGDYARRLKGLMGIRNVKVLETILIELAEVSDSDFEEVIKGGSVIFPERFLRTVQMKRKSVLMRKTPADVLMKTIDQFKL